MTSTSLYIYVVIGLACLFGAVGVALTCGQLNVPTSMHWVPTTVSPLSLVIIVVVSTSLIFGTLERPTYKKMALGAAIIAALASALLVLHEYVGLPLDPDNLIGRVLSVGLTIHTKPIVTACLFFVSLSSLALTRKGRRFADLAQLLLLPVAFCVMLSLNATMFNVGGLTFAGQTLILSLLEALSLFMLSIAIVGSRPEEGLMELLSDYSIPGVVFRQLLVLGIILPMVLGLMSHAGESLLSYGPQSTASLMTASTMIFLVVSWVWAAGKLGAIDVEYREAEDEISRLNTDLETQIKEIEEKNHALENASRQSALAHDEALEASRQKAQFFSNMSHEIRTPMNGVLGMVEIILRSELDPKAREYALMIREQGQALLSVINDILDFSKIETGKMMLELTDFEPIKLIEDTAEIVAEEARKRKISLMTYVDPEVPAALEGDSVRLRQVLSNLTTRAINREGVSQVLVQCSLKDADDGSSDIRFSVVDDGVAITEEEHAHLLEASKEHEMSPSTPLSAGILGLSLAQRLVELMGSQILWASEEGGTIFSFDLTFRKALPKKARTINSELDGLKVLVVDDDSSSRQILESYLSSWRMRCRTAGDGVSALGALKTAVDEGDPFKLAILDMRMPTLSGLELGANIRQDEQLKELNLILVTAYDDPELGNEAISSGFAAYFTKPIRQSHLFDCIINTISEATGSMPAYPALQTAEVPAPKVSPSPQKPRPYLQQAGDQNSAIRQSSSSLKSLVRLDSDKTVKTKAVEEEPKTSDTASEESTNAGAVAAESEAPSNDDLPKIKFRDRLKRKGKKTTDITRIGGDTQVTAVPDRLPEDRTSSPLPASGELRSGSGTGTGKVLVADDNHINRQVAELLLKEIGYEAEMVVDGLEALEKFKKSDYSMILMDCQMPNMDGFEATQAIRREEKEKGVSDGIPIIAMTADTMDDTRNECLAAGMNDFLLKPVEPDKLKATAEKWARSTKQSSASLDIKPENSNISEASSTSSNSDVASAFERDPEEARRLINLEELHSRFSPKDVAMLFNLAGDSLEEEMARLREAVAKGDDVEVGKAAHAFKGASMSLQAQSLYELLLVFEKAGKAAESERYDELLAKVEDTYAKTAAYINELKKG